MKYCENCGETFPSTLKGEGGKKKNLCNRKYCFKCSPLGGHNTRPLHILEESLVRTSSEGTTLRCVSCQREFLYRREKGHRRTICNSCSVKEFRKRMKVKAIAVKGSQCLICGYSSCLDALEFHHRDPNEKEFGIRDGNFRNWDQTLLEIAKCDLLCCRCHREVHSQWNQKASLPKDTYQFGTWENRQLKKSLK